MSRYENILARRIACTGQMINLSANQNGGASVSVASLWSVRYRSLGMVECYSLVRMWTEFDWLILGQSLITMVLFGPSFVPFLSLKLMLVFTQMWWSCC